jgi:C-terminal processing protease CtpA/Prc
VMQYFSNCAALIIDLRKNGGGWGEMGTLIASYLFEGDTLVQLGGSYSRKKDKHYQTWSLPYVPGKKMPDIPLYILTSKSTFSAAEGFSYNLKHLGRAKIVGETTRGGAHPLDVSVFSDFVLYIPDQMSVNPITHTNWEGVGVKPDIEVNSEHALNSAYRHALIQLARSTTDERKKLKYQWAIEGLESKMNPVSIAEDILKSYAGKYDSRTIYYENAQLFYQYGDRAKGKMFPLSENYFMLENYDYVRVKFLKENGIVTVLEEIFDDGRILRKSRN